MQLFGLDISQIVDLGTQVATKGAIGSVDIFTDDIFEYIIGVAIVVYEMNPG